MTQNLKRRKYCTAPTQSSVVVPMVLHQRLVLMKKVVLSRARAAATDWARYLIAVMMTASVSVGPALVDSNVIDANPATGAYRVLVPVIQAAYVSSQEFSSELKSRFFSRVIFFRNNENWHHR